MQRQAPNVNVTELSDEVELARLVAELSDRLNGSEDFSFEQFVEQHPRHEQALRDLWPALQTVAPNNDQPGESTPPKELGDYRIIREIGRGGMGLVYEAEQISLGRRVALKVLPFAAVMDERQRNRFRNESRAAATLLHPNIVPIYAVGTDRGVHYYAMQLIEGFSLAEILDHLRSQDSESDRSDPQSPSVSDAITEAFGSHAGGASLQRSGDNEAIRTGPNDLPNADSTQRDIQAGISTNLTSANKNKHCETIVQLGIQAAEALEHAHGRGIVHRDIKPGNLMIDEFTNLWITDFGLARISDGTGLTMTGDVVGTYRYMAPEQALGKRVIVDERVDIYSLGATLYELLVLRPVFDGEDREMLVSQLAFKQPNPLRHIDRTIPADLETIVMKCIEKNPDDRYGSAAELAEDLRLFQQGRSITARAPRLFERGVRWGKQHSKLVVGIFTVSILVAIISVASAILIAQSRRSERLQAARAESHLQTAADLLELSTEQIAKDLGDVPHATILQKKLLQESVQFYESLLREEPNNDHLRLSLAKAYRQLGVVEFTSIRQGRPNIKAAMNYWVRCLNELETLLGKQLKSEDVQFEYAQANLDVVQRFSRDDVYRDIFIEASKMPIDQQLVPATDTLRSFVAKYPDVAKYKVALVRALITLQDPIVTPDNEHDVVTWFHKVEPQVREAVTLSRVLQDLHPEDLAYVQLAADSSRCLARALRKTKRYDEAGREYAKSCELYDTLLASKPGSAAYLEGADETWRDFGLLARLEGGDDCLTKVAARYRRSIDLTQKLVDHYPEKTQYLTNRFIRTMDHVQWLMKHEQFEDASVLFDELEVMLSSQRRFFSSLLGVELRLTRGVNAHMLGEPQFSRKNFQRAFKHLDDWIRNDRNDSPDRGYTNACVHFALVNGVCPFADLRQDEKALELMSNVKKAETHSKEMNILGLAQMRSGSYQEALETFHTAGGEGPWGLARNFCQAIVLKHLGRDDQARTMYEEAEAAWANFRSFYLGNHRFVATTLSLRRECAEMFGDESDNQ